MGGGAAGEFAFTWTTLWQLFRIDCEGISLQSSGVHPLNGEWVLWKKLLSFHSISHITQPSSSLASVSCSSSTVRVLLLTSKWLCSHYDLYSHKHQRVSALLFTCRGWSQADDDDDGHGMGSNYYLYGQPQLQQVSKVILLPLVCKVFIAFDDDHDQQRSSWAFVGAIEGFFSLHIYYWSRPWLAKSFKLEVIPFPTNNAHFPRRPHRRRRLLLLCCATATRNLFWVFPGLHWQCWQCFIVFKER